MAFETTHAIPCPFCARAEEVKQVAAKHAAEATKQFIENYYATHGPKPARFKSQLLKPGFCTDPLVDQI